MCVCLSCLASEYLAISYWGKTKLIWDNGALVPIKILLIDLMQLSYLFWITISCLIAFLLIPVWHFNSDFGFGFGKIQRPQRFQICMNGQIYSLFQLISVCFHFDPKLVGWFLWHTHHWCLFNAKSCLCLYIKDMICKHILQITFSKQAWAHFFSHSKMVTSSTI